MTGGQQLFRAAGFLQLPILSGDVAGNLAGLSRQLSRLAPTAGTLLVLPEMWATGFVYAELDRLSGQTAAVLLSLQEEARRYGIVLAGSLPERLGPATFANTLFIVGATGVLGSYRKQQPFRLWREDQYFLAGIAPAPVLTDLGSIGGLICYDLRFPDLARQHCQQGADLLICSAMWPAVRVSHWRSLLQARAIENQTFMIGCNGVGTCDNTLLGGHSLIVSPDGEILAEAGEESGGQVVPFDWNLQAEVRSRFNSYAEDIYRYPDGAKILLPRDCLDAVRQRRKAGQQGALIHCAALDIATITTLQQARSQVDFLVVGIVAATEAAEDLAQSMAALGCVRYVVIGDNDDDACWPGLTSALNS